MNYQFPSSVLSQHTAILGKTGAGKSSTAKLLIEQVVHSGGRVCILDPIKSDWWGLTSSADGKHSGLPFYILGGPRGHVPLHAGAGAAIGEIVANGQLPLSILDMADFEPGGLQNFFTHFAPALVRKMRGVLYLVVEEAHEFAPKERAGFGAENLAIHWAKKLATAGRSKGIRLIVLTQRTQSLHNAILGSCDTMVAHRMTAPADQEPVLKWLKSNLSPEKVKEVAASLASLKTGEAWVCSGEAGIFERRMFPRISTFDNTATPTDDLTQVDVKTAAVDKEKLRAIVGEVLEEAKANDPAALKAEVAKLQRELQFAKMRPVPAPELVSKIVEVKVPVFAAEDMERFQSMCQLFDSSKRECSEMLESVQRRVRELQDQPRPISTPVTTSWRDGRGNHGHVQVHPRPVPDDHQLGISAGLRRVMIALAQRPGMVNRQIGTRAGVPTTSSTFRAHLAVLRKNEWLRDDGDRRFLTDNGIAALGSYEPLPEGNALLQYWLDQLQDGAAAILTALGDVYPAALPYDTLAQSGGTTPTSSTFRAYMAKLRSLELIDDVGRSLVKLSPELV